MAYRLAWSLDNVGNRTLETRLRAKGAAATDWTGGNLTRTVSNYNAAGTDWLTLTSGTSGQSNATGESVGATTQAQTSFGYDAAGNQTRETTGEDSKGLEWDFEGRLLRVEKGENDATRFTYDAGGQRVRAFTRAGAVDSITNYLVDETAAYAQVLEERDGAGVLQARYVYGQGFGPLLLQRVQKNAQGVAEVRTRFTLADGHGSVRQLMDEAGVVTDSYFYDAWGNGLSGGSGNTVNPYRYNGQQTDGATGGYYLRARYYQPGQGRFLGHDPVLGSEQDPVTLHRYVYAGADGINAVDPSGREWSMTSTMLSAGIAVALATNVTLQYQNTGYRSQIELISSAGMARGYRFPDVSDTLRTTLEEGMQRVEDNVTNWSALHLFGDITVLGSWDIRELTNQGGGDKWVEDVIAGTGQTPITDQPDMRFVVVDGQTFHTYSLNYVWFGKICKRSRLTRETMKRAVMTSKARFGFKDANVALQWAEAGYDGWPNASSTPKSRVTSILPAIPGDVWNKYSQTASSSGFTPYWFGVTGGI